MAADGSAFRGPGRAAVSESTTWVAPAPAPASAPRRTPFGSSGDWTPPPRPGLVPLRPMSFATVVSGSVRMMRRSPRWTLLPALIASAITTAIAALAQWAVQAATDARLQSAYYLDHDSAAAQGGAASFAAGWLPLALALTANAALGGVVGIAVARALVAERMTSRGMRRRLRGRVGALAGWGALVAGATVGTVLLAAAILVGTAGAGSMGSFLVLPVGFLVALVVAVAGSWLAVKLSFTTHVIAVERTPLPGAIRRSWQLTRGGFWRVLGTSLLVWVSVAVAAGVVAGPVQLLLDLLAALLYPNGGSADEAALVRAGTLLVVGAVSTLTGAVGMTLQLTTGALLYLDARMRREGLDLGLARYLEFRARREPVADPFPAPYRAPARTQVGTPVHTPIGTPAHTPVGTPVHTPVGTPVHTPETRS